ncbi:hypothetical protein [Sorangium sp. So ce1097]
MSWDEQGEMITGEDGVAARASPPPPIVTMLVATACYASLENGSP